MKTGLFTIHTYKITGAPEAYEPMLQTKLSEIDKEKLYKLLPGNRVISYHSEAIRNGIHEILPNTATISITPVSFHTLSITITPYIPLFRVREKDAITKDGIIYTELQDTNTLPTLSFASSSLVTPEVLSQMGEILPKISATLFTVHSVAVDEYTDIHVYGGNTGTSSVIISASSDIHKVWSNIVSAIATDPLKSKLENPKERLEYLDTRFGNKVFYKFTNSAKTAIIQDHDTSLTASTTIPQ